MCTTCVETFKTIKILLLLFIFLCVGCVLGVVFGYTLLCLDCYGPWIHIPLQVRWITDFLFSYYSAWPENHQKKESFYNFIQKIWWLMSILRIANHLVYWSELQSKFKMSCHIYQDICTYNMLQSKLISYRTRIVVFSF